MLTLPRADDLQELFILVSLYRFVNGNEFLPQHAAHGLACNHKIKRVADGQRRVRASAKYRVLHHQHVRADVDRTQVTVEHRTVQDSEPGPIRTSPVTTAQEATQELGSTVIIGGRYGSVARARWRPRRPNLAHTVGT